MSKGRNFVRHCCRNRQRCYQKRQQCRSNIRLCRKNEILRYSFDIVAVCGNKVECCFDKVERSFDIVAGVDVALHVYDTEHCIFVVRQLIPLQRCVTVIESAPHADTRSICVIAGPPTHNVGGQTSNGRWRPSSSSVVVCNTRICSVTHQGQHATAGQ